MPDQDPAHNIWIFCGDSSSFILDDQSDHKEQVRVSRSEISQVVVGALNSIWGGTDIEASVDRLCEMASQFTKRLPVTHHLNLHPVGICSQLPFQAGEHPSGEFPLIDKCTVSFTPGPDWSARAQNRERRQSTCLGVFYGDDLDLTADKAAFSRHFENHESIEGAPTAKAVLDRLPDIDFVTHLSCHGSYNLRSPLESALHLLDPLFLRQLLDIEGVSWLVNLSACETGIPDLTRAEQAISFPTAMLMAGASHVMATIWPIGNQQASSYNDHFYSGINGDLHPAVAHQAAISQLRDDALNNSGTRQPLIASSSQSDIYRSIPKPNHPFWWAGFVHYGPAPNCAT